MKINWDKLLWSILFGLITLICVYCAVVGFINLV